MRLSWQILTTLKMFLDKVNVDSKLLFYRKILWLQLRNLVLDIDFLESK